MLNKDFFLKVTKFGDLCTDAKTIKTTEMECEENKNTNTDIIQSFTVAAQTALRCLLCVIGR